MIAANVLLVSLTFRWLYRREPPRQGDGLARSLLLLAALVLLATPVLRALLFGPTMALVEQGGAAILAAIPPALLVNDPNPVFPFFAYGLFGAIVGAALARGEPRRPLYRLMGLSGLVLLSSLVLIALLHVETLDQTRLWQAGSAFLLLGGAPWLVWDIVRITRLEQAERAEVNRLVAEVE